MKRVVGFTLAVAGLALLIWCLPTDRPDLEGAAQAGRVPKMRPDYGGTVIPANMAPLNFVVEEEGEAYFLRIQAGKGEEIEVFSRTPEMIIPPEPWSRLLGQNRGGDLRFDLFVKDSGQQWKQFKTVSSTVAREDIDNYLVYRKIHPVHSVWSKVGVYQRDLRSYEESAILEGKSFGHGCVNCHSFANHRTENMFVGTRSARYGSSAILVRAGKAKKIGTKFGYTSWHPSGQLAAYSINKVRQFYHSARQEVRDVFDQESRIACYHVGKQAVSSPPALSKGDRLETYPSWSPDGKHLYFVSAPMLWKDTNRIPQPRYAEVKYDLMRIGYDLSTDQWGKAETLLSAEETGLSITEPRISPDGRWLLFCMSKYGCFPVFQASSDLYLMDLQTTDEAGRHPYRRLAINSDESESWHSFSSNGRWIAFSSKRDFGEFTRTYLSYFDETGKAHKPLLLPQKDPVMYDRCLFTYSVPEFVTEPVRAGGEALGRVVRSENAIQPHMPEAMGRTGQQPVHQDPWQLRE